MGMHLSYPMTYLSTFCPIFLVVGFTFLWKCKEKKEKERKKRKKGGYIGLLLVSSDVIVSRKGCIGVRISDFWVSISHNMLAFRQKQTIQQIGALLMLMTAAVLLSIGEGSSKSSTSSSPDEILFYGIIPVLVASILSGLASALCQWASQVSRRSL